MDARPKTTKLPRNPVPGAGEETVFRAFVASGQQQTWLGDAKLMVDKGKKLLN